MPFCPKCGTAYEDGTKFCGSCGENVDGASATAAAGYSSTPVVPGMPVITPTPNANQGPSFFTKILNTKDHTAEIGADDINKNKVMAILAFCGIFAYILFNWVGWGLVGLVAFAGLMVAPCLNYKNSAYVRFQLSQIYVAFFGVLLFGILDNAISKFFFDLICPLDKLIFSMAGLGSGALVLATIISWVIHLVFMAIPVFVLVIGFIDVLKNKAKEMPFIGKIKVTFEK